MLFDCNNNFNEYEKHIFIFMFDFDLELGLKDEDMKTLIENVSIVFNSAADLTFQTNLK